MLRYLFLAFSLISISTEALSERYPVSISHVEDHIYQVDGTDYYIELPYAYEYCYFEDVILELNLYSGMIIGSVYFKEYDYDTGEYLFKREETVGGFFRGTKLPVGYKFLGDSGGIQDDGIILEPMTTLPG